MLRMTTEQLMLRHRQMALNELIWQWTRTVEIVPSIGVKIALWLTNELESQDFWSKNQFSTFFWSFSIFLSLFQIRFIFTYFCSIFKRFSSVILSILFILFVFLYFLLHILSYSKVITWHVSRLDSQISQKLDYHEFVSCQSFLFPHFLIFQSPTGLNYFYSKVWILHW